MAMTVREYLAWAESSEGRQFFKGPTCECGGPLHEPGEKPYVKDGKEVCGDCCFDALGELVEAHSPASAGIRRG